MGALRSEHLISAAVAILVASTTLWYGGFPPEATAAISVAAWWAIALGVAAGIIPFGRLPKAALAAFILLLTLTLLSALSIGWASDAGRAFVKTVQISCALGIFLLALLTTKPGSARAWVTGIAFGLSFIALVGLASRFFPHLGDDIELAKSLFGSAGRLSWPLGYWNALGTCAAVATIAAVWFGGLARSKSWRAISCAMVAPFALTIYLTSSRGAVIGVVVALIVLLAMEPKRDRMLLSLAVSLPASVILVLLASQFDDLIHAAGTSTSEKQGLALMAATLVLTGVTLLVRRRLDDRFNAVAFGRPPLWAWIAMGGVVVIGLVLINPIETVDTFTSTPDVTATKVDGSNNATSHLFSAGGNGRWQYWTSAFDAFKTEPVLGIGAGGFLPYFAEHRESFLLGKHTHSLPLQLLAELGIIGFLVGLGFALVVLFTASERWRSGSISRRLRPGSIGADTENTEPEEPPYLLIAPALAMLLVIGVSFLIDWTVEFPVIFGSALALVAVIVGPATRPDLPASRPVETTATNLAAVGAIVIAGAGIYLGAAGFGMTSKINASIDARGEGNYLQSLKYANDAADIAPFAAAPQIQRALTLEFSDRPALAKKAVIKAIDKAPNDSQAWLLKARVEFTLKQYEDAISSFGRAMELDPLNPLFEGKTCPSGCVPSEGLFR